MSFSMLLNGNDHNLNKGILKLHYNMYVNNCWQQLHTILIYEIKLGYNALLPYLEDVLVLSASCYLVSTERSSDKEAIKFHARPENMTSGAWGAFKKT